MAPKFIVTNFAYGTGPYLRTTELALAFNDEMERLGKERLGILVPLVYGEKQKKVMLEEFSPHMDEIFLDEKLGSLLKSVFYGDSTYEEALLKWTENVKLVSAEAKKHLSGTIEVVSLSGKAGIINGKNIILELNRSQRIRYDIAPSYFTTFGYISEILERAKEVPENKIYVRRDLLDKGIEAANWVESGHKLHAVAYPATFSWRDDYKARYATEILTPPISRLYDPCNVQIEPGIFITITGIPGLEGLYQDAKRLGIKLYSTDEKAVPGSEKALPHIIPNPKILLQFARSGWGSVWLSMISGTPLIVPDFNPTDDPEIYFNNLAVENIGIGFVYRGEPLKELLKEVPRLKENSKKICDQILARWGTLDGNRYCAKIFAEDFVSYSHGKK